VSLEGTLETIALPDVLALLSVTAKTGELRVEANGGTGSLWLDGGRVSGFDVGKNRTPVDAFFALLRLKEGGFRFHTDGRPLNQVTPLEVGPVLEEAESRLLEWPDIVAVVPSLAAQLKLEPEVTGPVALEPDQWRLIASIGSGRLVGDVLDDCELGEFDGCKAVKELVDLKLVDVVQAEVASSFAAPLPPAAEVAHDAQAAEEMAPGPAAGAAADDGTGVDDAGADDAGADDAGADDAGADGDEEGYTWEHELRHGSSYEVHLSVDADTDADEAILGGVQAAHDVPGIAEGHDADDPTGGPVRAVDFSDDVWHEEGEEAEAATVEAPPEERGEPVNRGLLLKFLGSARN